MKKFFLTLMLVCFASFAMALPKVHIIATGGTIAGSSSSTGTHGYDAGQVKVQDLLAAVPQLGQMAEISYEQFCNIGSQDMNEQIWLALAKRINKLLADSNYVAIIITHGTDTMEETAYFLNLTVHSPKPVILVGAMRPSDDPQADGPKNLFAAMRAAVDTTNNNREVLCCLGQKLFEAGSVYKFDTHADDAYASIKPDFVMPHNHTSGFVIDSLNELPKVGIVYGYGGCSTLPFESFVNANYDGVVLAGVGMGNFYAPVEEVAARAVQKGIQVVRSARVPQGGVYTPIGEVDDVAKGYIAAGCLNPQKARILLMLALTQTKETAQIRKFFDEKIYTDRPLPEPKKEEKSKKTSKKKK